MSISEYGLSISRRDWSLHRADNPDEVRHNEKVKESIKDNLDTVISDGSIITADPHSKRIVKIPMRSLELPHIKYKEGDTGVGSGTGKEQVGDVIGTIPGEGDEDGAGDQPGIEYYEAELTIEELQELVFADLGLPNLTPKKMQEVEAETVVFDDVRKKRTPTNIDLYRTMYANLQRNAEERGKAEFRDISPDDFRVKTWRKEIKEENSAVVLAMADISGSMGDFEKYITRAFSWWTVNFLRSQYPKVEIVFIAHDTEAQEVNEEQFFSRGTGGGTRCSSANELALDIIASRYSPEQYNIYPLHFSDGENYPGDNDHCIKLLNDQLLDQVSQYVFVQIGEPPHYRGVLPQFNHNLFDAYEKGVQHAKFDTVKIIDKKDVYPALKKVFDPSKQLQQ